MHNYSLNHREERNLHFLGLRGIGSGRRANSGSAAATSAPKIANFLGPRILFRGWRRKQLLTARSTGQRIVEGLNDQEQILYKNRGEKKM